MNYINNLYIFVCNLTQTYYGTFYIWTEEKKTVNILIETPNILLLNNNGGPPRITRPNETYQQ